MVPVQVSSTSPLAGDPSTGFSSSLSRFRESYMRHMVEDCATSVWEESGSRPTSGVGSRPRTPGDVMMRRRVSPSSQRESHHSWEPSLEGEREVGENSYRSQATSPLLDVLDDPQRSLIAFSLPSEEEEEEEEEELSEGSLSDDEGGEDDDEDDEDEDANLDLDAGLDGTPMDSSEVEFQTSSSPSPSALEGRCVEADSMTDEDILRQATKSTAATGTQVPSSVFEGFFLAAVNASPSLYFCLVHALA